MATHSSILAWEIAWTEEPGGRCPQSCKELDMTEQAPIVGLLGGSIPVTRDILSMLTATLQGWLCHGPHSTEEELRSQNEHLPVKPPLEMTGAQISILFSP